MCDIASRVGEQLDTAVKHLDDRATILVEDLKSVVIKAADGYAMSLDEINRKLGALEHKWASQYWSSGSDLIPDP